MTYQSKPDGTWMIVWSESYSTLDTITIPKTFDNIPVTGIGDGAFRGCSLLTSITMPNSITTIGTHAFRDCTSLTSIELPDSLTSIGGGVFYGCSSLKKIVIPYSVVTIGSLAFYDLDNNATIFCENPHKPEGWSNDWVENGVEVIWGPQGLEYTLIEETNTYKVSGIGTCENTTIVIPDTYLNLPVTEIGDEAFYNLYYDKQIKSIILPDSVVRIGNNSFRFLKTLERVDFGGVKEIGTYAFSGCDSLKKLENTDSILNIGHYAFSGCQFTNISLSSIETLGQGVFESCTSLTDVFIGENLSSLNSSLFYQCILLKNLTLDLTKYTELPGLFFNNCTSLTITIPSNINTIWASALVNVKEVIFEDSTTLRYIDTEALRGTKITPSLLDLRKINFIGSKAFVNSDVDGIYIKSLGHKYDIWSPEWDYYTVDGSIRINVIPLQARSIINRRLNNGFKNTKALIFDGNTWRPLDAKYAVREDIYRRINGGKKIDG